MLSSRIWGGRHEMSAWTEDGTIFIGGGHNGSSLVNEVWSLRLDSKKQSGVHQ
jgi:hypothetical protein